MSGEQRLNSLDRFRKQPGRLILEEHGHCEVPAGCGGVVLRWRNPHDSLPLTIHLYTPVKAACFIDDAPLQTGRLDLAPGRHVLALVLEDVDFSTGLLMVAAIHEPKKYQRHLPRDLTEPPVKIVTAGDGTWKLSLDAPAAETWKTLDFDAGAWPALVVVPTPQLEQNAFGAWQCRQCGEASAACLGLSNPPKGKRTAWIRKVFELPVPIEGSSTEGGAPS